MRRALLVTITTAVAIALALAVTTGTVPATAARAQRVNNPVTTSTTITGPVAGAPLVGVNQSWDTQADLSYFLTGGDLQKLAATGARAVRLPVRCFVVKACSYVARFDDSIDFRTVTTWDFTQLDRAIAYLRANGYTPIIGLHPGDRMFRPGWIVDDPKWQSTRFFVEKVTSHLHAAFGPMQYSMFETELNTSLDTASGVGDAVYHYAVATGFSQWPTELSALYGGDLARLNATYATSYPGFDAVPVPVIGAKTGIPAGVMDSPATYDLRRVIARLSATRYSALGDVIHATSPGSEWWGPTVQLQSFHDSRQTHTSTKLTPVGPTPSDLASQPGIDVLSVDGYRNNDVDYTAAEWQVAAKLAARYGKKVAITEIGATTAAELDNAAEAVRRGASNLRAVLIWEGKDRTLTTTGSFGLIDSTGTPKTGRLETASSLFSALTSTARYAAYLPGTEAVYYPEWAAQVVQHGKLTFAKPLSVMSALFASGRRPEPVVDAEILAGTTWPRLTVFSLYLGYDAAWKLNSNGQQVVAYQYASHRTAFDKGAPVDLPLWTSRFKFTVSAPEATARRPETVRLGTTSVAVAGENSLAGYPFVHLTALGTAATAYGTHGNGAVLGAKAVDGSVWLDEWPGAASVALLYP